MHGIIYLVNEPSQSKESLVLSYMGYDVRIIHRILVQFNFVCAYYYKINHIHDIVVYITIHQGQHVMIGTTILMGM